nr:DEAD/DEAH box helicase [Clostridium bornimense]
MRKKVGVAPSKKVNRDNTILRILRKVSDNKVLYEIRTYLGKDKVVIKDENLRDFLEVNIDKKIKFTYDYLEINTKIMNKPLPLSFTLKDDEKSLIVSTHKKIPLPLTEKRDVYFFNNEIYLPPKEQIDNYIDTYANEKSYPKTIKAYNEILNNLSKISSNIIVKESVRDFASQYYKPEFFLYKEDNKVYCTVNIYYGNKRVNILVDSNDVIREKKKEETLLIKLCGIGFVRKGERLEFIGDDEVLFDILSSKNEEIRKLGKVVLGKAFKENGVYDQCNISGEILKDDDKYIFHYNIDGINNDEIFDAYEAYKSGMEFYKSSNGGFINFRDSGVKNFFNLLGGLGISASGGEIVIDEDKEIYISEALTDIPRIKGKENLHKAEEILRDKDEVPKNFKGSLRNYQIEGFRWFKGLSKLGLGGILSDEMGLGKTIQTIAFILSEENEKFLIVAPTSLIYNWKSELEKFAEDLRVAVVHGGKRKEIIENIEDYDVLLTSYGTLKRDIELYKDIEFGYCILDEGQNIKNPDAENTRIVKAINSKNRFVLTGTPIENNLMELWSIFDFIMPGYLFSKEVFKKKFIFNEDIETLKLLINPFILRRTKKEVITELPDKIEKKVFVDMTPKQSKVYKDYMKEVLYKLQSGSDNKIEIFSYLTKLRQICLDPSIIIEDYEGGSGKVKSALKLIKERDGKILLFSQFTSILDKLEEEFEGRDIKYLHLDGSVPAKQRIQRVEEFNNDKSIKVFLISLKAGGTGLNLTSASTVIHFDPWWNPAVEDQATDRAHRIGQKNVVEVIKLIAKDTIEEKIITLQENKRMLIENVINSELSEGNLLKKISIDEIKEIFR